MTHAAMLAATKLSMRLVTISLASKRAFSHPGIAPYSEPATIDPIRTTGTSSHRDHVPGRTMPSTPAAIAPTVICPSPPTFQRRAVNGIAAANAVRMRIPVITTV